MKILKRSRRDENMIVAWNIFFWLLITWLLIWSFIYIIPWISEANQIKSQALEKKQILERIKKEWVELNKIKEIIRNSWNSEDLKIDSNISWMVKEIDENFYVNNLKNTKEADYETFIKKKIEQYKWDKTNFDKLDITSKVLPLYDKEVKEENHLSEFEFINYIESIISTFNLTYKNPIWIQDVTYLDDYKLSDSDNSFDKWISRIQIDLDLVWRKSSILDFLYFVENVWKITINYDNWELFVNKPEKNNKIFNFVEKRLWEDRFKKINNYNIFNNQIIDIETIEMKDDIDSSDFNISMTEKWTEFLTNLKENQEREKYELKVKLNFYVKWLPKYKVEEFNKNFNSKLSKLESTITTLLSNTKISSLDKQKLSNLKTSVSNIKNSTSSKSEQKNDNSLIQSFQNNNLYFEVLEWYEKELEKINEKINIKK